MYVIDELSGLKIEIENSFKVVIDVDNKGNLIFGYISCFTDSSKFAEVTFYNIFSQRYPIIIDSDFFRETVKFSKKNGTYFSIIGLNEERIIDEVYTLGSGLFPYNFNRRYEAVENFNLFSHRQQINKYRVYEAGSYLNYTFGLEFETSSGYLPENICFKDGLIPLRDGSITGLEYSTVILSGNEGLNLLEQQLDDLKTYTVFDKDCSLHIHFGNFPMNPDKLFSVYKICRVLENELEQTLVPAYTFQSSRYKTSGKDYCKKLPAFNSFNDLYYGLVGKSFKGSFTKPHPEDQNRNAKWKINTRYYWVNFINILCYDVNKTIEFRLLRPSFNKEKIFMWLYVFNAILMFAEKHPNISDNDIFGINIKSILKSVYPDFLYKKIESSIIKQSLIISQQLIKKDYIGEKIEIENSIFDEKLLSVSHD